MSGFLIDPIKLTPAPAGFMLSYIKELVALVSSFQINENVAGVVNYVSEHFPTTLTEFGVISTIKMTNPGASDETLTLTKTASPYTVVETVVGGTTSAWITLPYPCTLTARVEGQGGGG